jgi:predicted DNA-binding protein
MSSPITLPNQLYERVRQTAQNKQQTVDEYITELISSALAENEVVPLTKNEALAREARAWNSQYPMLKE